MLRWSLASLSGIAQSGERFTGYRPVWRGRFVIWTTFDEGGHDWRALDDEVLDSLRADVGVADAMGVLAITLLIPIALHDDVSYAITVPWALAEVLCVIGWSHGRLGLRLPSWVTGASRSPMRSRRRATRSAPA